MTALSIQWRAAGTTKAYIRRSLGLVCLVCGLSILLTGCGDSSSTPSLTLMYWPIASLGHLDKATKDYAAAATPHHLPVVTQQAPFGAYNEKLLIEFAAQSAPDVFWLPSPQTSTMFTSFASHDGLYDLTTLVKQARANGQLHITATALKPYMYNGHVMAIPQGGIAYAIGVQCKHTQQAFALILQLVRENVPPTQ